MSLTSTRLSLTHLCTVERDANAGGTDDGWGNPQAPDWQSHLADLPCRLWATHGREQVADGTTITPVADLRLIVPLGTDVTDGDRVAAVTSRGDTVQAGPLGVRALLPRRDHLELLLTKVS